MQDPEKEKFILNSIAKIKALKNEIKEAKKNNVEVSDLMEAVQREVAEIQSEADSIFESKDIDISPEELEIYLQNPANFSKEDWELLETIKKETSDCKKEIIKAGEGQAVKDLVGKKKKKKGLKKPPRKA